MWKHLRKVYCSACFVALLTVLFVFSPGRSFPATASSSWVGEITDWSNVRTAPSTHAGAVTRIAPGILIQVYGSVVGERLWNGNAWYRISRSGSAPRYVYSGVVVDLHSGGGIPPAAQGKVILVSLADQWMHVYDKGHEAYAAPVTTGQSALATPGGTYRVFRKLSPATFHSPWPKGSPYWYAPTTVKYALEWKEGGYFLHDSWWRTKYGPHTNVWHYDPVYGWMNGTHGCITMPLSAAKWLYAWTPVGTVVQVNS